MPDTWCTSLIRKIPAENKIYLCGISSNGFQPGSLRAGSRAQIGLAISGRSTVLCKIGYRRCAMQFFVARSLPPWIADHAITICYTIHLSCPEHMNLPDAGANPAGTLPVLTSLWAWPIWPTALSYIYACRLYLRIAHIGQNQYILKPYWIPNFLMRRWYV